MNDSKLNIGVVIYTHDKITDAKVNMTIIRKLWQSDKFFSNVKIIHAYNGKKSWYSKKYLEDNLIVIDNPGHFEGAANLIDAGVREFKKTYPKTDYLIFLASDTWLVKSEYLKNIINTMQHDGLHLASCAWNIADAPNILDVGMATDFFIIDFQWADKYKMFPIDYRVFYKKYGEFLLYVRGSQLSVEKLTFTRYLQAIAREYNINNQLRKIALSKMFSLKEREPVHTHRDSGGFWQRKMAWPEIGLYTGHQLKEKRLIFKQIKNTKISQEIKKLFGEYSKDKI